MNWLDDLDKTMRANEDAAEAKRRADEVRAALLDGLFSGVLASSSIVATKFKERLGERVKVSPSTSGDSLLVSDHLGWECFTVRLDRDREEVLLSFNHSRSGAALLTYKVDIENRRLFREMESYDPADFGEAVVGPRLVEWAKSRKFFA